jgi:hypothetical protein
VRTFWRLSIGFDALASAAATIAFAHRAFLLKPAGYWRGAARFPLFAIAPRTMESRL